MAIENNLPIIFDVATQNEDGLMSFQDKIKLDNINQSLDNKIGRDEKIPSSMLDASTEANKIQPSHLSDAVKEMMTGQSPVSATVTANSVSTSAIQNGAVTIEKLNKTLLLGNVISPRPLNFSFGAKTLTINIPKGSLLMLDAVSERILVKDSNTKDVIVNLDYPAVRAGLNYLVSTPSNNTLSIVNNATGQNIPSTSSIVALMYITTNKDNDVTEASVVMHGSYTINGLAQGIGTESAALMGTGKIIFDKAQGLIDFTKISSLSLVIGGVFNRLIQGQASIRITDYSADNIYTLFWNNTTHALEVGTATINNSKADIAKIALIKDGRIIPYVDTGIYYSIPYENAPYYTENFEHINNITISSKGIININKADRKIEIPEDTFVSVNQTALKVSNNEAIFIDRVGMHYILFDLDNKVISTRFYTEAENTNLKNIVIGTIWVSNEEINVCANFDYTIDGLLPYDEDLDVLEKGYVDLSNIISGRQGNYILASDEMFMIEGEELPVYESSMMFETAEGIKTAISYNKDNEIMKPRTNFFDGDILLDDHIGDNVTLLAHDKYGTKESLKKEVKINKVPSNHKDNHPVKLLCIGDDLIHDNVAYYINNKLTAHGVDVEMLGTMNNSDVSGEGRTGWLYSTFVGASGRGREEGKINPQTAKGSSSKLLNPFIRLANTDDKQNYPNDCYRSTGAYIENTVYKEGTASGAFYIFDFDKYMEVQGITDIDVVVLALKPELSRAVTENFVSFNMQYLRQIVNGIREALPDTYIALVPQYGASAVDEEAWMLSADMIDATNEYVEELKDDKIKVIPAWLHMNRETGTKDIKLSETGKIELANAITAFIMNIE